MKSVRILMIASLLGGMVAAAHAQGNQQPSGEAMRQCAWVLGAVRSPLSLTFQRRVRLSEILAIAGGTTEHAGATVTITNAGPNCSQDPGESASSQLQVRTYRIAEILSNDERVNPYLLSGDMVVVNETDSVYVTGAVIQPRKIDVRKGRTLTRAIAMAGGFRKDARTDNIIIYRPSTPGQGRQLIFDSDKIRKQRAEDPILQPSDIIEVRFRDGRASPLFPRAHQIYDAPLPVRVINGSRAGI